MVVPSWSPLCAGSRRLVGLRRDNDEGSGQRRRLGVVDVGSELPAEILFASGKSGTPALLGPKGKYPRARYSGYLRRGNFAPRG